MAYLNEILNIIYSLKYTILSLTKIPYDDKYEKKML